MEPPTLLNPSDPNPVRKTAADAVDCPFVLLGDHAGAAIPQSLDDLGLAEADRARHIALDIGVEALGRALSARLGAPFVSQAYSRLVVDCNRDPADSGWIARESDGTRVPGNAAVPAVQRKARRSEIFEPYHRAIEAVLDARNAAGRQTVLVSLHSFTPALGGERRPWQVGVLHDGRRDDFALGVLARLRALGDVVVGDNQPYRMDSTDYTVPRHAYPRGLRYVELEVRQDLLADPAGIAWADGLLGAVLPAAVR
jgi:predicted N-formylglutamate amidohydrolase